MSKADRATTTGYSKQKNNIKKTRKPKKAIDTAKDRPTTTMYPFPATRTTAMNKPTKNSNNETIAKIS